MTTTMKTKILIQPKKKNRTKKDLNQNCINKTNQNDNNSVTSFLIKFLISNVPSTNKIVIDLGNTTRNVTKLSNLFAQ